MLLVIIYKSISIFSINYKSLLGTLNEVPDHCLTYFPENFQVSELTEIHKMTNSNCQILQFFPYLTSYMKALPPLGVDVLTIGKYSQLALKNDKKKNFDKSFNETIRLLKYRSNTIPNLLHVSN